MTDSSALVYFQNARYDEKLKSVIFEMLDTLIGPPIHRGARVLIKPNLLMASPPEQAILTHPLVVRAVAEYVLAKGGRCRISDSPAIGSFEKLLKDAGYTQALQGLDIEFTPFSRTQLIDIGPPFGRIALAAAISEADVIINIAKLKTHVQMCLTLGVKNLFGCVVGLKKTEWHMRAGVDRSLFARLLVQICKTVNPTVTLVDGILALEGQGPGKMGRPKFIGTMVGGKNPFAVDSAICGMFGISPEKLPSQQIARSLGLIPDGIKTAGPVPAVRNFAFPVIAPLIYGPKPIQHFARKHWIQRPVASPEKCTRCGKCVNHCPATAIKLGKETLSFNYNTCIRCYCCVEICPSGALETRETPIGKMLRTTTETARLYHSRFREKRHTSSQQCNKR